MESVGVRAVGAIDGKAGVAVVVVEVANVLGAGVVEDGFVGATVVGACVEWAG
jgi:hypothetical protein